jgi:hypothetical protein
VPAFELQFPCSEVEPLAARFPELDESRLQTIGAAVRARGHYTREEFIEVCAWKTPRSRPRIMSNAQTTVAQATRAALTSRDEAARMLALLELDGVGVPTASTLLYVAFPADYPILDVRALESLGVRARSTYPLSFWLAYLAACRELAARCGVSLRTLDKALWEYSKERSAINQRGPRPQPGAGSPSCATSSLSDRRPTERASAEIPTASCGLTSVGEIRS